MSSSTVVAIVVAFFLQGTAAKGNKPRVFAELLAVVLSLPSMIQKILAIYRHGFALAFIGGLGALMGLLWVAVPAFIINEVAAAFGRGMDSDKLMEVILACAFLWLPLGLGIVFRMISSDELKGEDYPPTGLAGLAARIKAQRP